jgi:hypothetical protein
VLGAIETIQGVTFCQTEKRYRDCIARAVAAQFLTNDTNRFSKRPSTAMKWPLYVNGTTG